MPTDKHNAHVQSLLAKKEGSNLAVAEVGGRGSDPQHQVAELAPEAAPPTMGPPPREAPKRAPAKAKEPPPAAEVAEPEAPEETEEPEPPPAAAKPARPSSNLARSLELQRRSEAAQAKSRAEASRVRADREAAEAEKKQIADRARRLEEIEARVTQREREANAAIELLRTDPATFMRRAGMTAQQIADFQRRGLDPLERAREITDQKIQQAVAEVRAEARREIDAIKAERQQEREVAAEREVEAAQGRFFEHVSGDADRFEALNTIYSPEELWTKATSLAERNVKLQLGWDGDRLCEELEARARKDPRWDRISKRFSRRTPNAPNAPAHARPNAQPKDRGDEGSEAIGAEETEEPQATRAPTRRSASTRNERSVRDKHRVHVERMMRTARIS